MSRLEVATACNYSAAHRAAADFIALLLDGRAACSADGASHTGAQNERGIGRIDNRVGVDCGDIVFGEFEGFIVGVYIRRVV